jgi:hypothetical protein
LPDGIDLLMLDADGRIDRDFLHFYDRLSPSALILVDDMDGGVFLHRTSSGVPYVDLKHRITSLLLKALERAKYLVVDRIVDTTAFCRRGSAKADVGQLTELALSCYRELVFTDVDQPLWHDLLHLRERRQEIREALRLRAMVPAPLIRFGRRARALVRGRTRAR